MSWKVRRHALSPTSSRKILRDEYLTNGRFQRSGATGDLQLGPLQGSFELHLVQHPMQLRELPEGSTRNAIWTPAMIFVRELTIAFELSSSPIARYQRARTLRRSALFV